MGPMALGDRYIRSATAAVEKRIGERPLRIAFASRPGATAAVLKGELLAGAGIAGGLRGPGSKIKRESGKDTRLPTSFLIAVTPARVYVYKHRMLWGSVRIKRELGVFDRDGLVVEVSGKAMKRFMLHSPQAGQTMAFEMLKHRVTDELAGALRPPA
jgi:hypothetical protein